MAKIFAFPGPRQGTTRPHFQAQAAASNHDTAEELRLADWDNNELAGLYRVEDLLVQANVRISTGRGVSDEGDPWFVFCRDNGEVFVHLARIDGSYLLDSPGLTDILRGPDFAELINRFVRQVADKTQAAASNVVAFRPRALQDQMIRLHPSVMLAALVWSLYLASDDFVSVAEAMEEVSGNDQPNAELKASEFLGSLAAQSNEFAPELTLLHLSQSIGELGDGDEQPMNAATAPMSGETVRQTTLANENRGTISTAAPQLAQGVAASLALIAVSYGFLVIPENDIETDIAASGITSPSENSFLLASAGELDFSDFTTQSAHDTPMLPESIDGQMNDAQISHSLAIALDISAPEDILAQLPVEPDSNSLAGAPVEPKSEVAGSSPPLKAERSEAKASAIPTTTGGGANPAPASTGSSNTTQKENPQLPPLFSQFAGTITDYQFGNVTVATTLNYSDLDKVLTRVSGDGDAEDAGLVVAVLDPLKGAVAPGTPTPSPTGNAKGSVSAPHDNQYDAEAQRIITQFIRSAEKVELIQFNMEIVLIDMTAIDDPTDIAYTRRWVTDDGHVISTIGHLQDFLDYGIA